MLSFAASHIKSLNRQVAFDCIRHMGETSRAEIVRLTGMSFPTVIKNVNFLIEQGLVMETGEGEAVLGRKPQMLQLKTGKTYVASFFWEGNFLRAGLMDIFGKPCYTMQAKVPQKLDGIFEAISSGVVEELLAQAGAPLEQLKAIGIALPGSYRGQERIVVTAPIISVHEERDITQQLSSLERRYKVDVVLENDANAQVLGEFSALNCTDGDDLLFISLGTGLGAGLMLDGKLRRGAKNFCGGIGYLCLDRDFIPEKVDTGWLESRLAYHVLEERFCVKIDAPHSQWAQGTREEMSEYVAHLSSIFIYNAALLLGCERVIMGGVTVEALGESLLERINNGLARMGGPQIRVQLQSTNQVGLTGITHLAARKYIADIMER